MSEKSKKSPKVAKAEEEERLAKIAKAQENFLRLPSTGQPNPTREGGRTLDALTPKKIKPVISTQEPTKRVLPKYGTQKTPRKAPPPKVVIEPGRIITMPAEGAVVEATLTETKTAKEKVVTKPAHVKKETVIPPSSKAAAEVPVKSEPAEQFPEIMPDVEKKPPTEEIKPTQSTGESSEPVTPTSTETEGAPSSPDGEDESGVLSKAKRLFSAFKKKNKE